MEEKFLYDVEISTDSKILVQDLKKKYTINLVYRLMDFAVNTISFLNNLPFHREYDVFRNQLSKAVTSIGANYEESQASSYREFRQRIRICLREAREANYWIRLLNKLMSKNNNFTRYHNVESSETLTELEKESREILLIFGSISSKINKRLKQSPLTK